MGYETWFRGEGAGVPPARPGGHLQDFGDGMYLTDSVEVAKIYAQRRAPRVEDQRVWMATLERKSLGIVLDLTLDSRWSRFMNEPLHKGASRLHFLKIKHELYNQFFREFVSVNKINIDSFDAVIGPEYNLGGKQLCILHKNGQASKLNLRVRVLFRPITSLVRWTMSTPGGKSLPAVKVAMRPASGKIRYLKGVGGFVASIGVWALLSYLYSKVMGKVLNSILENEIKKLDPEIQASVETQKRQIFDILASGGKAYVTVKIKVEYTEMHVERDDEEKEIVTGVAAELVWVEINDYKVEGHGGETLKGSFGGVVRSTVHTLSSEVKNLSQEEVDQYSAAMQELQWYEDALRNPKLVASDLERLKQEKKALEDMINQTYGVRLPEYAPGGIRMTYEESIGSER
jgi:hypothetical protein